jgi:hypothetical protein
MKRKTVSERVTQERDATLTVLALNLHGRKAGSWPNTLDELVPDLMPIVPRDRFTGGPLLYRLVNDRPLLYSAGPDKKDDNGRPIANPDWLRFNWPPMNESVTPKPPDGDWILWPPQEDGPATRG